MKNLKYLLFALLIFCMIGAGPTPPPLVVKESDGSPKVTGVTEIQVSAGTLTNIGGGKVGIAIGTTTPVVDNLSSTSTTSALSAAQGKVLNDSKAATSLGLTGAGLVYCTYLGGCTFTPITVTSGMVSFLGLSVTVSGSDITFPGKVSTTAADGSRVTIWTPNTGGHDYTPGAGEYSQYVNSDGWHIAVNGTQRNPVIEGVSSGGLIFGDSTPDAAGEIGYNGDLQWYDATGLRTAASTDGSQELTGKTYDVDGTGNVLKTWGYLVLTHPHVCAAGAPMQTTSTANTFGQCKFGNATDKATNYAEYYLVVPADIDTSVDLVGTFKIKLGGADTGDHEYEISFDSVADSAAYAGSLGDAVSLAYTADANGAENDVETAGPTTLTGWKSAMTAGQLFVIRVARDGDHANDASTVDSYSGPLVIKYKITQ